MARLRELLSLTEIADETGISYATLRNYTLKYADEIPSEGDGRSTRYPRSAVKVFQRLRRESKPGRKPKNASATAVQTPPPVPVPVRHQETRQETRPALRQEAPRQEAPVIQMPVPAPRQVATDTSGMEKELAAIRGFLERIANSLEQLASAPRSAAPAPAPEPAAAAAKPEAPASAAPAPLTLAPAAPREAEREGAAVPLPSIDMRGAQERTGHRRLQSLPKVFGQRGRRPE